MKKSLFFAAIATILSAGCVKHEVNAVPDEPDGIVFQAVTAKAVPTKVDAASVVTDHKGYMNGSEYNPEEKFLSAAFNSHDDAIYIDKSVVSLHTEEEGNKTWRTDEKYYWPTHAFGLSFFSASPAYLADQITFDPLSGVTLKDFDITKHNDVDFMVADVQTSCNATNCATGVPTLFRHKLAQIVEFNVILQENPCVSTHQNTEHNDGDRRVFLNLIEVTGLYTKATYVSSATVSENNPGLWTPVQETSSNIIWYKNEYGGGDDLEVTYYSSKKPEEMTGEALKNEGRFVKVESNQMANDGVTPLTYIPVIPTHYNYQTLHVTCTIEKYNAKEDKWEKIKEKDKAVPIAVLAGNQTGTWTMGSKVTYNIIIAPFGENSENEPADNTPITWKPEVAGWTTLDRYMFI